MPSDGAFVYAHPSGDFSGFEAGITQQHGLELPGREQPFDISEEAPALPGIENVGGCVWVASSWQGERLGWRLTPQFVSVPPVLIHALVLEDRSRFGDLPP